MSKGRRPDPRKRKTPHAHASYLKVACKQRECGWLAGEMYGCYTHRTYASQPCLDDLTEGHLSCSSCKAGIPCEWRGYVPLWDKDFVLRYCLVGEAMFEPMSLIQFRSPIIVSRGAQVRSPLVISNEVGTVKTLPNADPWKTPVEMLPIMLTLWKCPELDAWFRRRALDAPPAPPPVKSDGQPFGPMTSAAAKRYSTAPAPEVPVEDDLEDLKRKLKDRVSRAKPSTNGHHAKPE